MVNNVKIIIGANYGDEGKGLATNFFCRNEIEKKNKKVLNILCNGGAQRGHTVYAPYSAKDQRHVFSHFGSGSFAGAVTYCGRDFMINPIAFNREWKNLISYILCYPISPYCYIDPECRITTPFDMYTNGLIETKRGEKRHGSCGMGIFETMNRYKENAFELRAKDVFSLSDKDMKDWIRHVSAYHKKRLIEYGIYETIPHQEMCERNFLIDIKIMRSRTILKSLEELWGDFDTAVFEAGQGLALSADNEKGMPFLTPSLTTSERPVKDTWRNSKDLPPIEICYVTRSYFTRHGAGGFPSECSKKEINDKIIDATNVPNEYQKSIRYGKFEVGEFLERINRDYGKSAKILPPPSKTKLKKSLFVTHLNYTNGDLCGNCGLDDIGSSFDKLYLSSDEYGENVDVVVKMQF